MALRPAGACDQPFLYRLFESTHGQQFALLPLASAQRDGLLRMQFNAQRTGYRQHYPHSQDFLVLVDEEAAGRVWLNETATEVVIVDVAVLPRYQGQGHGTAVLRQVIDDAARTGKTVRLRVARLNSRAAQLYRRLGFQAIGGDEVFEEMEIRSK